MSQLYTPSFFKEIIVVSIELLKYRNLIKMSEPSSSIPYFFNVWAIPYWFTFFVSFVLTVLLFYKKRDDEQIRLFILAIFFTAILSFTAAMASSSLHEDLWLIWSALYVVTTILATTFVFHFSQVLRVNSKPFEDKKLYAIYAVPVFFIFLVLIDPVLGSPVVVHSDSSFLGLYERAIEGVPLRWLFFTFFVNLAAGLLLFLTTVNFIRMFKQHEDLDLRRRASYFVLAPLIALVGMSVGLILVEIFGITLKFDIANVFVALSVIILAYGTLRVKLFDIDLVVKKSFSYAIVSVLIAWIFLVVEESLSYFVSEVILGGISIAYVLSGIVIVVLILPLKDISHKLTDKLFPDMGHISTSHRDIEIYRKLLEFAEMDHFKMLKELRSFLGISEDDHKRLEQEVISNHK